MAPELTVSARVRITLLLALVLLSIACSQPSAPSVESSAGTVRAMQFVKHPNGACFGIVEYAMYGFYKGVAITYVPIELCR